MFRIRTAATVLSLVVVHTGLAVAQTNRTAVQAQVVAAEKAINDAIVKNDMKAFHANIAPDAVSVDGMGITKAADFDKMMADIKAVSYAITGSQFMWLDDANVVHMYKWTGKGTYQGQPIPDTTWSSTVWQNRGGKWLAVLHTESPAMPMPPPASAKPAAAPAKK
jgi:hypothetical protein